MCCQPSGAISKHRTASHRARYPSIAPPLSVISNHCTTIGSDIQASHHRPLGGIPKHRASSHREQSRSITPPPSVTQFQALRHHWALIQSIAPPPGAQLKHCAAIGGSIEALRRQRALNQSIALQAIRCKTQALRRHWAQNPSIALPAIERELEASRHHRALIPSTAPPLGASTKHRTVARIFKHHRVFVVRGTRKSPSFAPAFCHSRHIAVATLQGSKLHIYALADCRSRIARVTI